MSCHDIGRGMASVADVVVELYEENKIDKEAAMRLVYACRRGVHWCDGNESEAIETVADAGYCGLCFEKKDDLSSVYDNDLGYPQCYNVFKDFDADAALAARVKSIYYSEEEILTLGGKPAAVPCCPSTNGCTEASQTYPYLRAVASPWDAFCAYRDSGQACVGVSLNGLDWLCRHGLSAEEALLWYLPGMEISS